MSFAPDPFRRSRSRTTIVRSQRTRRATAGAAVAVLIGAVLLMLPGGAAPVQARDGVAIARWTWWVRHTAHAAYVDLAHEAAHGAALAGRRDRLTDSDFLASRNEIRHQMAVDKHTIARAHQILTVLDTLRNDWFHLYGGSSAGTILGPSQLTAQEMAAFVRTTRIHVHTTVPVVDIARMYLEEGELEGVRGDVAFAQALKETGFLASADTRRNNFAGLGHCSACPKGFGFATARAGVRAQIELLRWLADPTVRDRGDFTAQPPTMPMHFLHLPHSRATWASLGGLWAPSPTYGASIFDMFLRMRAYAASHWRHLRV